MKFKADYQTPYTDVCSFPMVRFLSLLEKTPVGRVSSSNSMHHSQTLENKQCGSPESWAEFVEIVDRGGAWDIENNRNEASDWHRAGQQALPPVPGRTRA